jgi:hypothetical protein
MALAHMHTAESCLGIDGRLLRTYGVLVALLSSTVVSTMFRALTHARVFPMAIGRLSIHYYHFHYCLLKAAQVYDHHHHLKPWKD